MKFPFDGRGSSIKGADGQVPTYAFNTSIRSRMSSCATSTDCSTTSGLFESDVPFVLFETSIESSRFRFAGRDEFGVEVDDSGGGAGLIAPFMEDMMRLLNSRRDAMVSASRFVATRDRRSSEWNV